MKIVTQMPAIPRHSVKPALSRLGSGFRKNSLPSPFGTTLALCLLLLAMDAFANTLGDIVIGEQRMRGSITLYVGNTPGAEMDSQLFIQDNDSLLVSQIYTGSIFYWPDAASDLSRIIVYDGIPHTPGSLVIFALQKGGAYQRIEEDFTRREVEFEQQRGLIPWTAFETEYIGLRAEFTGID